MLKSCRYVEDAEKNREAAIDAWILSLSEGRWKPVKYSSQEVPRVHKLPWRYSGQDEQQLMMIAMACNHILKSYISAPMHVTRSKMFATPQSFIPCLVRPFNSKASAYLQI